MTRRLEAVGYWFNERAPSGYPRPQGLPGRWTPGRRAAVVAYLRAAPVFEVYGGSSFCRFGCGVKAAAMGHRDRFDGAWVWPEGLAHYVEVHGVRLPPRFVRRAVRPAGRAALATLVRPRVRDGLIDEAGWLAWGRAAGATLAVGPPWQVPDWRAAAAITARAAAAIAADHPLHRERSALVLWRPDTREAVFVLARGRLAIVGVGRGPRARTRLLAGWAAWPRG